MSSNKPTKTMPKQSSDIDASLSDSDLSALGLDPAVLAQETALSTRAQILADPRRRHLKMDDAASSTGSSLGSTVGSSIDSRGGRRRRRRNKTQTQAQTQTQTSTSKLAPTPVVPRLAETKPPRLQIGLNLEVELELKAKLQGDVCLSILVEEKFSKRSSKELKPSLIDGTVDGGEIFFIRIGRLSFRQRWLERQISPSLTTCVIFAIFAGGFAAGLFVSALLSGVLKQWLLQREYQSHGNIDLHHFHPAPVMTMTPSSPPALSPTSLLLWSSSPSPSSSPSKFLHWSQWSLPASFWSGI